MGFDFAQIDGILNARSIAIVGASNSPLKFGGMLTASQLTMGFAGPVYLVNPNEEEIMGHEAYPDLLSLPETPDLVYIVIPADRSLEVLEQCGQRGVKGVVMIPAGFREVSEEGKGPGEGGAAHCPGGRVQDHRAQLLRHLQSPESAHPAAGGRFLDHARAT